MRRIVALLVVALALAACSSSDTTESSGGGDGGDAVGSGGPQTGGSLVFGTTGESTGWLPFVDRWGPGPITVAKAIFDPLVAWGTDQEVHPYAAESFTPNTEQEGDAPPYSLWDIKMREGATFHNGEPVDAHSVVLSLQKMRVAPLTTFAMQPVVDIAKVPGDDYTLRVTLDPDLAELPTVFASQAGFLVAPEQIRNADEDPAKGSQQPIGSGPFVFSSWTPDTELVATRYDSYWRTDDAGNRLPYLDEVIFQPTPDELTRINSLQTGDIDVTQTNSPGTVSEFLTDPSAVPSGVKVLEDQSESDEFNVILNAQTGPLADERLRQALQLATDRQAIVGNFENAFAVADGPMTPESKWWADAGWPEPDLEQAKQLVADYQADNPGDVTLTLIALASPDGAEFTQLLQQQWAEIGITTNIEAVEETDLSNRMVGGDFDAIATQFWNGGDPDANYVFWTGDNIGDPGGITLNFPRWSNDEIDAALNTAREAPDEATRKEAYAEVWKQWAEHVPYIWVYHSKWLILYRDNVQGLADLPLPDGGEMEPVVWGAVFLYRRLEVLIGPA